MFLAEIEQDGSGLPRFVVAEFERYLRCGILANGFARVRCVACGDELLVAFSCKSRGICPSCTTRRMQGTAAHLVDRVLPCVPMRHWVFSLPRWARFLLARDPALITRTLHSPCAASSPDSGYARAGWEFAAPEQARSPSCSVSAARST